MGFRCVFITQKKDNKATLKDNSGEV